MPLYACEQCGFTSAAFRTDAAAAHRLESPHCGGVIRIIFRSEDRYRGRTYRPAAGGGEAAARTQRAHERSADARHAFAMREYMEPDGTLRLTLLGDLDLTASDTLSTRVAELKASGRRVRIDLSKLTFIDSSGVQAILAALTDARWTGWQLEVAPEVSPTVERAAQIVGIAQVLWPRSRDPNRTDAATSGPIGTE